ncbi:hypothetical protein N7451_012552 [Penicillium sp. IBT 35674x]|nr:hypothetical protein N7451_012552 [Penicillium sp. IBT 35674x]
MTAISTLPVGIDLTQNQTVKDNVVVIVMATLAAASVIMRMTIQIRTPSKMRCDDWIMVAAMPAAMGLGSMPQLRQLEI